MASWGVLTWKNDDEATRNLAAATVLFVVRLPRLQVWPRGIERRLYQHRPGVDAGAHGHLAHPVEVALQSFEHTVDRLVHQEAAVHLQKPAGSRIYETRLSRVAIPLAHRETCVVAVTVMRGAGEGRVDLGTPKVLIRS